MGFISENTEVLYAELNEIAEAATGSYSVTGDSLQYIYSVPVGKIIGTSDQDVQFMNFPSQMFFDHTDHGYRAAILKKKFLRLFPFYMVVATYFCYEKVCRTMRTAIVSKLPKYKVAFFTVTGLELSHRKSHILISFQELAVEIVNFKANLW